jgi:predicted helicase
MADIFYHAVPTDWRREQKYRFLEDKESIANVEWQKLQPDKNHNWLTEGMSDDFESFIPMGTKERETETICSNFSSGVTTCRDAWVYNYESAVVARNVERLVESFNTQVYQWGVRKDTRQSLDDFVLSDPWKIVWSEGLKLRLARGGTLGFDTRAIRPALYRPFNTQFLYLMRH